MSTDAQIAREWAEGFIKHAGSAQIVDADELTAARYILAATTPPTMADIAWDDEVHAGLCAEHPEYGLVRMMSMGKKLIECLLVNGEILLLSDYDLTPIPGTRLDLAPRREPEPESTPDHPTVLTTEEDYDNAPVGTIAADDDGAAVKAEDGTWRWTGSESAYLSYDLCYGEDDSMTVVRWGK